MTAAALLKPAEEFGAEYDVRPPASTVDCTCSPHWLGLVAYASAVGEGYTLAEAAEARHAATQAQAYRVQTAAQWWSEIDPTELERDALHAVAELAREQEAQMAGASA